MRSGRVSVGSPKNSHSSLDVHENQVLCKLCPWPCDVTPQAHVDIESEITTISHQNCKTIIPKSFSPGLNLIAPAGPNVFQSVGHYWRLSGFGQRGGGGVQTETSHQVHAVDWTSFPWSLPDLHGKSRYNYIGCFHTEATERQICRAWWSNLKNRTTYQCKTAFIFQVLISLVK